MNKAPDTGADQPIPHAPSFRVGTLTYTKLGLASLFFWLLWGDVCFTLMEKVVPSIMPLKFREFNAPGWLLGFVLLTIPNLLNTVLNPIISTASDRLRTRFGRRIPFLLFATPFITVSLLLLGFFREISDWMHGTFFAGSDPVVVALTVLVLLMTLYKFFDLFDGIIFWYIFNDVVPQGVMARFLALFRVIGVGAGAAWSFYVFPLAESHFSQIFVGVALLYFTGFGMMCLRVKEGEYPPPVIKPRSENRWKAFLAAVVEYPRIPLSQRIYRLMFAHNVAWSLSSLCTTAFSLFLTLSMGISLGQIGQIGGWTGILTAILAYPAGMLADRYHPVRVMLFAKSLLFVLNFGFLAWVFLPWTSSQIFTGYAILNLTTVSLTVIYSTVGLPMQMRIFPREVFGQLCSFNALCTSASVILFGVLAGFYVDFWKAMLPEAIHGKDYHYRMIVFWPIVFQAASLILLVMIYREWHRHLEADQGLRGESLPEA